MPYIHDAVGLLELQLLLPAQLFSDANRQAIKVANPGATAVELIQLLASAWGMASEEEKAIYQAQHQVRGGHIYDDILTSYEIVGGAQLFLGKKYMLQIIPSFTYSSVRQAQTVQ
jgi:hypothetical protein